MAIDLIPTTPINPNQSNPIIHTNNQIIERFPQKLANDFFFHKHVDLNFDCIKNPHFLSYFLKVSKICFLKQVY